jgi:hypothetical protein
MHPASLFEARGNRSVCIAINLVKVRMRHGPNGGNEHSQKERERDRQAVLRSSTAFTLLPQAALGSGARTHKIQLLGASLHEHVYAG